ncbi:hypothetical protein F5Y17DRAFT_379855 [Xylariaceae sp. FL0594]|nr:hypothetical protein F5Y17DRAFT_379855 [Xylariaceae sp. FL0594]
MCLNACLRPDYSMKRADLFAATTRGIIEHSGSLEILQLCFSEATIPEGLPSWVPDWAGKPTPEVIVPTVDPALFVRAQKSIKVPFRASKNTKARLSTGANNNIGRLTCRGVGCREN